MAKGRKRYELIEASLRVMSRAGNQHGAITIHLTWRLAQYVEAHPLGTVCAVQAGFISRNPDTVRATAVAFVSQA